MNVAAAILAAKRARILPPGKKARKFIGPQDVQRDWECASPFPPGWKPRLYVRQDARRYDAAEIAHAPDVVAREVHEHDVFRAFLRVKPVSLLEKTFSALATLPIERAKTFDEKPVRASRAQPESLFQSARVGGRRNYFSTLDRF